MDSLKKYFDFIPERILKSTFLKVALTLCLVSFATIFERQLRLVDPRMSILIFYPLIMISIMFIHARATFIIAAMFLQFFILSDVSLKFRFPQDLIVQVIFLLSNLLTYRLSQLIKREAEIVKKELEEEMSSRFKFTSTLGQLIRTSTSLLKTGGLFMKDQNPESDKFKKALTLVIQKGDELDQLMKDVVNVSVLASGEKLDIHLNNVSLRTIVQEVVASFEALHPGKIILNVKSDGAKARWNEEGMRRMFSALCSNAIKFGNEKPVNVNFVEDQNHASFTIQNSGTPIDPKEMKELFMPFRTMLKMRKGPEIRPGLNLTLVKGMVEAHGGNIKAVSNAVEGTHFQILLPRRIAQD